MNFQKLFIVFLFVFLNSSAYSQNKVKAKTFAIIDTSKTKVEQAHEIYSWITKNISYDVKEYVNGSLTNKSALEILKRRKGICADYSLLFNEMCYNAGIGSYTVIGYSKGADYFKGGGFYRADHSWNAIHVDSLWYLADLTWGSGYLLKKPSRKDKIRYLLFKTPYINKKLVFVKAPNDKYFNISTKAIAQTHLPLDPKWQLTKYPYSIQSFEKDTLKEVESPLNYKDEILNSIGLSGPRQTYIEGMNGKKFNPKNDFDIGFGCLSLASEFNDETIEIDEKTLNLFKDNRDLYQNAKNYISHFKLVNDSVFNQRLGVLKKESRHGKKIVSSIGRKLKMEKNFYTKNQQALLKRYESLSRRVERYENKIMMVSQRSYLDLKTVKVKGNDSALFNLNLKTLLKSVAKSSEYKKEIDSLTCQCLGNILTDSLLSIDCLKAKNDLNILAYQFRSKIATEDNLLIFPFWGSIKANFNSVIKNYKNKALNLAVVRSQFSKITSNMNLMAVEFASQIELIGKFYKYSNDSVYASIMISEMQQLLNESYHQVGDFTKLYQAMNEKLMEFNTRNYELNEMLRGTPLQNIKLFIEYDDELCSTQKRVYENEKEIIKNIENQTNRGIKRLDNKISVYLTRTKKVR